MGDLNEVIFTSDSSGQLWNTCVWNPKTGTSAMHYKGGISVPHSVALIGCDYIISADSQKPIVHIWPLNSQEQIPHLRFVTSGKVNALTVSPDGNYCIAGIDEKIYIWQVASGRLLNILNRHYQKINCLKFFDTSTHFVSGGEDGQLIIWCLSTAIAKKSSDIFSLSEKSNSVKIFSDHALPITDIYIGKGCIQSRFASVSLDRTCKIYNFHTQLLTIVFEAKLTTVTMNRTEQTVFVGSDAGSIYEFHLINVPRTREYHAKSIDKFAGHKDTVTCLSVSLDNETLLSGSKDNTVILWNIPSRNVIRTIEHKGPITNAFFTLAYKNIFSYETFQPRVIITKSFERNAESESKVVEILNVDPDYLTDISDENISVTNDDMSVVQLRKENEILKELNKQLYEAALNNIVQRHVIQESDAVVLTSGSLTKKRKRLLAKSKS